MITDFELRVLAEIAYADNLNKQHNEEKQTSSTSSKSNKKVKRERLTDTYIKAKEVIQNWSLIEVYRNVNNTDNNVELDAYLFKRIDGFYAFVYRGTNSKSRQFIYDMKENLTMFFSSQVTQKDTQLWQAFAFTTACIKLHEISPKMVTLTGHSKGGALAAKVGFLHSLMVGVTLRTRTFAPALAEMSHILYLNYPKPSIDCINYIIEGDRVTNGLTKLRFSTFLSTFAFYKLFKSDNKRALGRKSISLLWGMWTLHPYIGVVKTIKPNKKSLLRHSLVLFDDYFDNNGML